MSIDRLDALLRRFHVGTRLFHAGALCGITDLASSDGSGHLHVIRSGRVELVHSDAGLPARQLIEEPTVLLYPTGLAHRFLTDPERGADMVCAEVHFGGGREHPLARALPAMQCWPISATPTLAPVIELLIAEAFGGRCGGRIAVDRLFEVLLIQLLRLQIDSGQLHSGLLAGLAHPQLRRALIRMHEAPAEAHTLVSLAECAQMSRSRFAETFRQTVGMTALDYLGDWRITLAQSALRRGRSLQQVADEVGYGSAIAFNRAFKARTGSAPGAWRRAEAGAA